MRSCLLKQIIEKCCVFTEPFHLDMKAKQTVQTQIFLRLKWLYAYDKQFSMWKMFDVSSALCDDRSKSNAVSSALWDERSKSNAELRITDYKIFCTDSKHPLL